MINQVTVFLENAEGRLAALTQTMAAANVNMKALSIADTAEYGVVRIICADPEAAVAALDAAGYRAMKTPVSAIAISDVAGGLAKLMAIFDEANVDVPEKVTAAGFKILAQADL